MSGARRRIGADFFRRDPLTCARELIGATFVSGDCEGRIVETEAYTAKDDPAAHTFTRPSTRRFIEEHRAGAAYVYFNYGMYWLANVLVKGGDTDGFVLIRALEPIAGIDTMRERRGRDRLRDLCSGPGKLTIAMGIDGSHHGETFVGRRAPFWFRHSADSGLVVSDRRIGISRAVNRKWRFLLADSEFASRPIVA